MPLTLTVTYPVGVTGSAEAPPAEAELLVVCEASASFVLTATLSIVVPVR